jgi:hypothetical protein
VKKPNGGTGTFQLKNTVFCIDFTMNLVLFRLLRERGYYWNNKGKNNYLAGYNDTIICTMEEIYGQQVIEYVLNQSCNAIMVPSQSRVEYRKPKRTSRYSKPSSKGDTKLWHLRMGYPGPQSLHHLEMNMIGAKCSTCTCLG